MIRNVGDHVRQTARALISGLSTPFGIAESGGNLFVTNYTWNTIGEYTTAGATVNAALVTGLNRPIGIAAFEGNLFVANQSNNTIGEYTMSGATVNPALVSSGFFSPYGVAVVPESPTWALLMPGSTALFVIGRRKIKAARPKKFGTRAC